MAFLLGVDTGGTYTDAVILDDVTDRIVASAKALTSRPDLALGVGAAIDAALAQAAVPPEQIAMVSLSTTLATNALVEGQGGRVCLVAIGFDAPDLRRAGVTDALGDDPVLHLAGGHDHAGTQKMPLDLARLEQELQELPTGITGFAVAGSFAARNPAHEIAARDLIRAATVKPVTCGHELSQALGGPKRALTAVLNARLIGLIDRLISAVEGHIARCGIDAPLMVVRGDGALVSADVARTKPIETILSGPAASVAGAGWLTGAKDAFVSDIGGTTTDICLLRDGKPLIDPQGARVGPYRTMVEAVAMRTHGLGGDSELHFDGALALGPRRLMPIALFARQFPQQAHRALDLALAKDVPPMDGGQFVVPVWDEAPEGLAPREAVIVARLADGPLRIGDAAPTRLEISALHRLVSRGFVMLAGVTPSDAAHVLGRLDDWDGAAAEKALTLAARRRTGAGDRIAADAPALARMIVDQLTRQTVDYLLQAAFAEDGWGDPETLASHPLAMAGLDGTSGLIKVDLALGLPVVGLGASAHSYYGAVGDRLKTRVIVPDHAGVANAVGAVVGQVSMQATGSVTSPGPGRFVAHLHSGPQGFETAQAALDAMESALRSQTNQQAQASGVEAPQLRAQIDIAEAQVEGQAMFVSAEIKVTASGRPRIAVTTDG
ncbi:hydantoinase/oxoprolinase N-terminal domain-containing protein [Yoonia sediminilitoris]|uniref:N-methylhydantoinase A/oxoprolinase/acetone carboxylase beta subunit n=1 Tax=Yoonia sediminilitoris TaxID=1286148 RepID=A0A2T6K8L6_9RHOB|nr:hydantoinase/oxoprolinase family protein [Yoonia sediminilitoris]PUB11076.1 N-methylhydantoinase A/oxoprolinase/acetone carboxylase beta subunit [Yoonia sediminilitoris]RCW90995.1 N-methylhydantoinase A/oxoprolinase/acetone carboxylase beta subunit [Yoonia sediminilitoris]